MPTVLALETSCDESAAAVLRLNNGRLQVIASRIASQVEKHAQWGGVVPEVASRLHVEALPHLVEEVLQEAGQSMARFDAVAATVTPGLAGALMVGSVTGRSLAALHALPFFGIHHLEGHLASVRLAEHQHAILCKSARMVKLTVEKVHREPIAMWNSSKTQLLPSLLRRYGLIP